MNPPAVAGAVRAPSAEPAAVSPLPLAMATDDFRSIARHAGQARRWLVVTAPAGAGTAPAARAVELARHEVFHHWRDTGPHPLDGIPTLIARSAGDGFLRRMAVRGVRVVLTAEADAERALAAYLAGQPLPPAGWDLSLVFCRARDLFSRH